MKSIQFTFGVKLLEAHRDLMSHLHQLAEVVEAIPDDQPELLARDLETTRTQLLEHFALEEQDGYMNAVLERQPHLERAVQRLHGQHRDLRETLEGLIAAVRAGTATGEALRERVRTWLRAVRRHEQSENILVEDAFSLDIGSDP